MQTVFRTSFITKKRKKGKIVSEETFKYFNSLTVFCDKLKKEH